MDGNCQCECSVAEIARQNGPPVPKSRMDQTNTEITLSNDHRKLLEEWVGAHGTPQQVALRCRIILLNADGWSDVKIASELGVNRHTCRLWRQRMLTDGPKGLWEVAAGRGRKPQAGLAEKIIEATLAMKPEGQTHWSSREMARQQGVHHSTVARIWSDREIKPHRHKTFKLGAYAIQHTDTITSRLNLRGLHHPNRARRIGSGSRRSSA